MKVLVIDDELPMRVALVESLQSEGYRVSSASDGEEALEKVFGGEFDLILLDVMMPKIDGFTVCAEMRKRGVKTPVLMLTAKGMVDDRVRGLDCGADDYLVKPFSLKELLARVRALVRRVERAEVPEAVCLGGAMIDLKAMTCEVDGEKSEMTAKEVGILRLLLEFRGEVVSRDRFLDEVWGYHASPTSRTVDNFIAELRKKLGNEGSEMIKSVRGKGYRLVE
ncbi:response regulator transcription factor [Verrucomicrobiaceae bacterium 227]